MAPGPNFAFKVKTSASICAELLFLGLLLSILMRLACRLWPNRRWLTVLSCALLVYLLAEASHRALWILEARRVSNGGRAFELYILGESSAFGLPYGPDINVAAIASKMLGDRIAARPIVVHLVARDGATLPRQWLTLQRMIRYRDRSVPGVVFVYSGNNEGKSARRSWLPLRAYAALQDSAFLTDIFHSLLRMHAINPDKSFQSWVFYLRQIVKGSLDRGLMPILTTVPSNIADIEPYLQATETLPNAELERLFAKGDWLEATSRYQAAIAHYQEAMNRAIRSHAAELSNYFLYRIGKCQEKSGQHAAARATYWQVVDSGISSFDRTTPRQNREISKIAEEFSIPLVDSIAILESSAKHRLLGNQFFTDLLHPNLHGYFLIGRGLAKAISHRTGQPLAKWTSGFSEKEVAASFGFSKRKRIGAHLLSADFLLADSLDHIRPEGRIRLARQHCERALKLDPCHPPTWTMIAALHGISNNRRLSREDLFWLLSLANRSILLSQLKEILASRNFWTPALAARLAAIESTCRKKGLP